MKSKSINYPVVLLFILFFSLVNMNLFAQTVRLTWSASDNPYIFRYGIYRSTHIDSSFELINTVQHPDTIYSDNDMKWNSHYYYVATSVDNFGNESNFSNMIDTLLSTNVPVELISFSTSIKNNNDVLLTWLTATETNNYGFELQRSENNTTNFQKIGFVRSEGTTSIPGHYSYVDKDVAAGEHLYRLKQIDFDGSYEFSDTIQVTVGWNKVLTLHQNNPNPFNSTTLITYDLPKNCQVELIVYNVQGQEVNRLVHAFQEAGYHTVKWDGTNNEGKDVTSGLYYYKLRTSEMSKLRRMLLVR
jgi:hypothetical protein